MNPTEEEIEKAELEERRKMHTEDYFENDVDLLALIVFLEGFNRGKKFFRFSNFLKGKHYNFMYLNDDLPYDEFFGEADEVFAKLEFMFESVCKGEFVNVGIVDMNDAVKKIIVQIASVGKEKIKDEIMMYHSLLEHIYFLDCQNRHHLEEMLQNSPSDGYDKLMQQIKQKSLLYDKEVGYFEKFNQLMETIPSEIAIFVEYNNETMVSIEKDMEEYITNFSLNRVTTNLNTSYFFEEQMDAFFKYINTLNPVGKYVNIPFSSLNETSFEVVKILRYLEMKKLITLDWSDETQWKVSFSKLPLSTEMIKEEVEDTGAVKPKNLKSDLSYDEATSILKIGNSPIKITGNEQKVFLKIIFKDKNKLKDAWFFSEIAEIYDGSASIDDKKFYNIAYNLNKRIASDTEFKQLFILTKQTVQINPKYLLT